MFNTPPFEISPQVLTFLRDKALQDRLPVTEFLRLLKLVCFDYFSSSSLICSNDWLLAKHGIVSIRLSLA